MRTLAGLVLVGATLVVPMNVGAAEVVYFTNGTYMHVISHEVKGEMVRVRLDGDAAMAFPSKLIEKIEGSYGVTFSKPSVLQANQAAPSPAVTNAETPYPVGINPAIAGRATAAQASQRQPYVPQTTGGELVNNGKAEDTMVGSARPGPSGSQMIGNRTIIDSGKRPGGKSTFTPSPLQARSGLEKPNNGLPTSPFPAPTGQGFGNPTAGPRRTPVDEPPAEQPESEGGP